jgi:hypothetical protein
MPQEKNSPDGMMGVQRRFVKFGGGMSGEQLDWLRAELAAAKDEGQRVVVFCHQPLHPDSCTGTTLAWNYAEVRSNPLHPWLHASHSFLMSHCNRNICRIVSQVMDILQQAGNVVAAFAGHTHQVHLTSYSHTDMLP